MSEAVPSSMTQLWPLDSQIADKNRASKNWNFILVKLDIHFSHPKKSPLCVIFRFYKKGQPDKMIDSYMHWQMHVYEDNIAQTDTLLNKVFNFIHLFKRYS